MTKLSEEQLNNLSKEELVAQAMELQDQYINLSQRVDCLTEQVMLMNQRQFGRKTEKNTSSVPDGQMNLFEFFNEVEALAKPSLPEPSINSIPVKSHSRKQRGKREEDLKDLPIRIIEHTLSDEELKETFPNGYKELPDEIYKRLCVIPATFIVDEHHVHVYASLDNDGTIIKAPRSVDLLRNSIATPSIVASTMNAKYALANPLDRQSKCFKDNGVNLSTNTLANWMIRCSEDYLSILYDIFHKKLYEYNLLHADETPVKVSKDGRPSGSKSYMWVYRGEHPDESKPIVLYDYQKTRKLDHPREFLKDFKSIVVTDGYQVYHSIVETAKANNLRTYDYLELLLTEIPNHMDDKNFDYFEHLMPWSDYVQEKCHSLKIS